MGIPPWGRGFSRHAGLPIRCSPFEERRSEAAALHHAVLLALVRERIDDPIVMDLIGQTLHCTVDDNCLYLTITRGISLGCPLSPVMAAIYL